MFRKSMPRCDICKTPVSPASPVTFLVSLVHSPICGLLVTIIPNHCLGNKLPILLCLVFSIFLSSTALEPRRLHAASGLALVTSVLLVVLILAEAKPNHVRPHPAKWWHSCAIPVYKKAGGQLIAAYFEVHGPLALYIMSLHWQPSIA